MRGGTEDVPVRPPVIPVALLRVFPASLGALRQLLRVLVADDSSLSPERSEAIFQIFSPFHLVGSPVHTYPDDGSLRQALSPEFALELVPRKMPEGRRRRSKRFEWGGSRVPLSSSPRARSKSGTPAQCRSSEFSLPHGRSPSSTTENERESSPSQEEVRVTRESLPVEFLALTKNCPTRACSRSPKS